MLFDLAGGACAGTRKLQPGSFRHIVGPGGYHGLTPLSAPCEPHIPHISAALSVTRHSTLKVCFQWTATCQSEVSVS